MPAVPVRSALGKSCLDAIYFDLDGTLTDPKIGIARPFRSVRQMPEAALTFPKELV